MKFTKMQGAGNDFVVIDTSDDARDWGAFTKAVCDRHFGVGADGVILVMPSKEADFRMREFNVDGSEAEACGNGLRCLTRYVAEMKLKGARREITIETIAGSRKARIIKEVDRIKGIQVGLGKPIFAAEKIPVNISKRQTNGVEIILDYAVTIGGRGLALSFISMGNPHAVCFIDEDVKEFPLTEIGPQIEHYKIFPRRTNFEIARLINKNLIEARVWERGVGETMACGSGAGAIAVAAVLHNYIQDQVNIQVPGGTLIVEWDGKGEVLLTGPAEIVFHGEYEEK